MRVEKKAIAGQIEQWIGESPFILIADYRGLKAEQLKELRAQLRGAGAEFHVVKNRIVKQVIKTRDWTGLDPHLRGPSGIVVGQDVTQAAKALRKFTGEHNSLPAIRAGVLDGALLTAADIDSLAQLPSREVLIAQVVGTMAAPISRLVGVMKRKVSTLVIVLKAIEKQKGA
jgi:large subunit ribosomal protein L10